MSKPAAKLKRFVAARFSPGDAFGLHLTAGAVLMMAAVAVFAEVAQDVAENSGVAAFDRYLSHWMQVNAQQPYTNLMWLFTHLHSVAGMALLVLLAACYFWRRAQPHGRYWLLALLISVPGGMLLNVVLKQIYQRARPQFDEPLVTLTTYSFPSGHTVAATLFWGLLVCYAVMTARSWRVRCAVAATATLMVALTGISRVYMGAHYPSDVLAAIVEGCGWLAVCISGCSTLRRRREAQAAGLSQAN